MGDPVATEIRLAFALNGGVSLAIWIGGVADEVLRAINGGRLAAEGSSPTASTRGPRSVPSSTSRPRRTCSRAPVPAGSTPRSSAPR